MVKSFNPLLLKDIKKGEVVAVVIPHKTYIKDIILIAKHLAKSNNALCYVSLDMSYNFLIKK